MFLAFNRQRVATIVGLLALAGLLVVVMARAPPARSGTPARVGSAPAPNVRPASDEPTDLATLVCDRCNVLLISIDTLRADRMGLYGYSRPNTPHLVELAKSSVVFDRFYQSGGGTLESHMSMLTSLNPITHGVTAEDALDSRRVTLAEALKGGGLATAAFVDDGWMLAKFGFAQGFDIYDDAGGRFAVILPKAHNWLKEHRQERFFLFVHTYDVHSEFLRLPFECPGDYRWTYARQPKSFDGCRGDRCASYLLSWIDEGIRDRRWALADQLTSEEVGFMSDLYDGCINYVDARIADLLGALRALGHFDDTLIVITSDHGEEFGEHGMVLHEQGGYEELSHVPLMLKLPYSRLAGRRVPHLAAMVDLMPTVLSLLGMAVPADAQGRSLLPAAAQDRPVRQDLHIYGDFLISAGWRYFPIKQEIYDLTEDPAQRKNLFGKNPRLEAQLAERLRRLAAADETTAKKLRGREERIELTPEERARLQALGYLQ